ncbi:CDP-glycerol:poly(glycerophosphate) glycerophosphotransferase [Glaciihabitans tibetensis]|uniref:CDP-glycerol:poly(Glycerophosphate) glycerophosphotransferase n=1 Tax=Glaciihabitans tibetensis TaxID=1266600 RepID=A0A2T0VGX3_9MICO|nr:CDP-glycerol glycerophosphotransferase family protein [Glaciihabitans tibetensis]PRY69467.1 CDP-glycerol:poly(glycerophosphate) glycerophosphotransferase [Glaciihabitans tibetensis]
MNAALRTHPLPAPKSVQIAIYFADDEVNLYQVRQWYAPMAELAKTWPVTIISRSPTAALALWDEAPVPVVYLRSVASLENFVDEQDLRIVFYINQNARNFQMFRYGEMWHVFINHGESDKMYMTTNQFKAYDYSLIAGEAARDRLERTLWNFDLDARTRMIGRPQADHLTGTPPYPSDDRTTVLYAPTWEGDRPAAAYGSVASHGVRLVDGLLATGRHRVIYRPHPRSGVVDHGYARANRSIIAAIARANAADPSAQHVYDTSSALGWQLAMTDVAITDISAMIYDRLATGKPLLVTRPVAAGAEIDRGGYLEDAEWLEAAESADIVELVDRVLYSDAAKQKLSWWVERYFGDTSPGAATARLHAAVQDLMDEWDVHAGRNGKAE